MAVVVAVSWIPRSYVHIYETYESLKKIALPITDVTYDKELSFIIPDIRGYKNVRFTQEWSGLHYFQAQMPDENVTEKSKEFMTAMQMALVEDILKACHTVTYKQILNDVIPINFHLIIFSKAAQQMDGYTTKTVGGVTIQYDPKTMYASGMQSHVQGTDDTALLRPMLYHAYAEIVSDFLFNMQKRMTRLYHEADSAIKQIGESSDLKVIRESILVVDEVLKESAESYGKIKQARSNMGLKRAALREERFSGAEKEVLDALDSDYYFNALISDADYAMSLWSDVLIEYIKNISTTIEARLMLLSAEKGGKGGWFR